MRRAAVPIAGVVIAGGVWLTVALVGAAPASASAADAAAAPSVAACDLVSLSEAQSLLPVPVVRAPLAPGVDPNQLCVYGERNPPPGFPRQAWVAIDYHGHAARDAFLASQAAAQRNTDATSVIEPINGLGDRAYHYRNLHSSMLVGGLVIQRGDFVVDVSVVTSTNGPDDLGLETTLAKQVVARLPVTVPPAPRVSTNSRASLPGSFPDPTKVDTSPKALGASAGLTALLMLMLAFPSQLFDRTLTAHYRTVRGWFGPLARLDERSAATVRSWPQPVAFSVFMIIGGLLAALLDPTLGWNLGSLALVLGLVVSRAVVTVAFALPELIFMRRHHQLRGRVEALPGALVVAAMCVLVSRLAGFQPGYLYGIIVGIGFARELSRIEEGRVASWVAAWVLGVSLVAWFVWTPVVQAIGDGDTSFPVLFIDAVLATIFVTGVETVVIGLLPLHALKGKALLEWNRRVWTALYTVGAFLFVWVLVHPESNFVGTTHQGGEVTRALVPFLVFGTVSVALWCYLRNRPEDPPDPAAARPNPAMASRRPPRS